MTKSPPKDVGLSVRARLLRLARERGEDFQLMLTRYANERLLFRLAASAYKEQFVLKGATLFTLWTGQPHRATRDLDLLGFGDCRQEHIRDVFSQILVLEVVDDGVRFDPDTLAVSLIREEQEYGGIRIEILARITTARVRLQIDVGFGDAITPEATLVDFPPLLDFPAPRLRAYPRETVVAEKLEAMVQLGMANSRMKDFYDLLVLARDFEFNGEVLVRAIRATFERRQTSLSENLPVALTAAFAVDRTKQIQWSGFVRKAGVDNTGNLAETIEAVTTFVEKPLLAAAHKSSFTAVWREGGPWR